MSFTSIKETLRLGSSGSTPGLAATFEQCKRNDMGLGRSRPSARLFTASSMMRLKHSFFLDIKPKNLSILVHL